MENKNGRTIGVQPFFCYQNPTSSAHSLELFLWKSDLYRLLCNNIKQDALYLFLYAKLLLTKMLNLYFKSTPAKRCFVTMCYKTKQLSIKLILIFLVLHTTSLLTKADDFTLCSPIDPKGGKMFEYVKLGFKRIQHNVNFKHTPVERCHIDANIGYYDGICASIEDTENNPKYKNLIKVPCVLSITICSLWTIDPSIEINSIDELDKYKVGYVRGIKIVESILQDRTKQENYVDVSSHEQIFEMLLDNRIDVALDVLVFGRVILSQPRFKDANIYENKKQFGSKSVHIYLHKKHSSIVPALSNALEELQTEGEYKRILGVDPPDQP